MEHSARNIGPATETTSRQSTHTTPQSLVTRPQILRRVLHPAVKRFFRDTVPLLRVVLLMCMVFLAFLVSARLIFALITWAATDSVARIPFAARFLEGLTFFSFVGVAVYCVLSTSMNLQAQWKMSRQSRKKADPLMNTLRQTQSMWAHLAAAVACSALAYALLRAAGYAEELSFRLGSIAVPVITTPHPNRLYVRLQTVSGKFLVILFAVYLSIIAAGPATRRSIIDAWPSIAGVAIQSSVVPGMLGLTFGLFILRFVVRLPQGLPQFIVARVYRGHLVLMENNGAAVAIKVAPHLTIYRPGRMMTIKIRFLQSLVKREYLVLSVRTESGASTFEQIIQLQPRNEVRIDLWTTVTWVE